MLVEIVKLDEVWGRVTGDFEAITLLSEHFTFEVTGAKFSPKHINNGGSWDGYIRLLNRMNGKIYLGLIPALIVKCAELSIRCSISDDLRPDRQDYTESVQAFINDLQLPFEPHDFQSEVMTLAAGRKRMLIISPTSSGKSLIIYMLTKYFNVKTLIISPKKSLILQLKKDLISYGCQDDIHTIMAGSDKNSDKLITISTWQSLKDMPEKYFHQYEAVIGDEVHLFEAKSLVGIMERTTRSKYRFGLSGSLRDSKTHILVLTGLFGGVHETISTREMIDRKISSDIEIIVIVFVHSEDTQKNLKFRHTYQEENDLIVRHTKRNKYITKLVESLEGNTIVMFRKIEKHGEKLKELLDQTGKTIHYIHGGMNVEDREAVREIMEQNDDQVLLASSGTTSTGVSINNVQNMIQGNGIKSSVDVAQTIGRGLRKDGKANKLKFFDLGDKFIRTTGKNKTDVGYSYKHLTERLKIYAEKQLPYKIVEVPL